MTTPLWSYRIPLEHRDLMRRIADALKRDPALAAGLEAALAHQAAGAVGPFRDEGAALGFIRDRLILSLDPEAIWLFGSRARGTHRAESDFDILVVLPDALGAKASDYRYALEPLLGSGLACDVVPCPAAEFERAKGLPGTIAHEAVRHGRLLYRKRRRTAAAA